MARRAGLALLKRGFAAEVLGLRVAADARDVQRVVKDLNLEHSQSARWPGGIEARAFLPEAGERWRRSGEFQGAVRVNNGPSVGHFHVGNRLLQKAIEVRGWAAGIDKVVAATRWRRAAGLIFGAVARHVIHQKSRGQFSVAILILFSTATPFSATRQPQPRQICRSRSNQLQGLQCWWNIRSTSLSDRSG